MKGGLEGDGAAPFANNRGEMTGADYTAPYRAELRRHESIWEPILS